MSRPPDKGGGDLLAKPTPDQITMDPAQAGHGVSGGTTPQQRPFAQIIAEETANRNTIQLHLRKIHTTPHGTPSTVKNLTFEDLGDFLLDILKINPKDLI